ncbi:hypothetical protein K2173_001464 [Erythroxylum novogranatense]|uniref:Uncharacterized protein n=1 Tax=Erythroxylum novogranatense TaxID=1862640 RepID=A0AAV8TQL1_9ROSI|nr:hypothetical protein K2173_001464 [Erythroxylum novogranatense]
MGTEFGRFSSPLSFTRHHSIGAKSLIWVGFVTSPIYRTWKIGGTGHSLSLLAWLLCSSESSLCLSWAW